MHHALLIFAAVGSVLLWQRAAPLKPIREGITIRLNRWWEHVVVGRGRLARVVAWPLWWLRGVLSCGECLVPYVGFAFGLGEGWKTAILIGFASYAVWGVVVRPADRG